MRRQDHEHRIGHQTLADLGRQVIRPLQQAFGFEDLKAGAAKQEFRELMGERAVSRGVAEKNAAHPFRLLSPTFPGRRARIVKIKVMLLPVLLMLCVAATGPALSPAVTKVLNLFQELEAAQQGSGKRVSFILSDSEINEYLSYSLRTQPRPGLCSASVKLFPDNYVSFFVVADFDAIESWKPGSIPPLLRPILSGRKEIWLDVRFRISDSAVTFSVEKAYFQKVRLPAFLVEKLIELVAARQPEKYDTRKPVPLPFGLRHVSTGQHVVSGAN